MATTPSPTQILNECKHLEEKIFLLERHFPLTDEEKLVLQAFRDPSIHAGWVSVSAITSRGCISISTLLKPPIFMATKISEIKSAIIRGKPIPSDFNPKLNSQKIELFLTKNGEGKATRRTSAIKSKFTRLNNKSLIENECRKIRIDISQFKSHPSAEKLAQFYANKIFENEELVTQLKNSFPLNHKSLAIKIENLLAKGSSMHDLHSRVKMDWRPQPIKLKKPSAK